MEIKDKLSARQASMQMATDVMIATAPLVKGYDINNHLVCAKGLYDWVIGNAELPEVYDPNTQARQIAEMFMKAKDPFKMKTLWFQIFRDENGKPTERVWKAMRDLLPIMVHDSKRSIVIGSLEEFDRRKQEIIDNADYTEYCPVADSDTRFPIREPITLGIVSK